MVSVIDRLRAATAHRDVQFFGGMAAGAAAMASVVVLFAEPVQDRPAYGPELVIQAASRMGECMEARRAMGNAKYVCMALVEERLASREPGR